MLLKVFCSLLKVILGVIEYFIFVETTHAWLFLIVYSCFFTCNIGYEVIIMLMLYVIIILVVSLYRTN